MKSKLKILLVASTAIGLTACGDSSIANWRGEAGSQIDEGGFGNPTMNNVLIQTGELQYAAVLNERFSNEVPTMINFAFDSAQLTPEAQAVLRRQADWIRQFPEVRFRVYGHTDLVGSTGYNQRLGLRRAQAAVRYLVSQGISRSRLEAVVSFGETRPLIDTQDREERNRRTVTEVTGFVARHPTLLDGKYANIIYREYVNSAAEAPTVTGGLGAIEGGGG